MQGITITYNGLLLGDGSNFYISELDPGELTIRQADQLAAGRDGGFIFNQNYGMRFVTLDVNIFSGTDTQFFEDVRALRQAFSRTNTARELVINYWDGSVRKIDCFPFQLPNPIHTPGNTDKSRFRVVLQAPFPFYKGSSSDVINETLYLDQSLGFDYPFDYPFDYEAGVTSSVYTFNNDGDAPALIAVQFNGPVIGATLTNQTNGEYVQIDTTIPSGQYVTLAWTSSGRVVESNSGVSFEQYFNGATAFFTVPLGSNTFRFTASTFDASASCDITLTKYFLS